MTQNFSGERLLRLDAVQQVTGLSRAGVYRAVRSGSLPHAVKISERSAAWPASEVEDFVARKIAARADAQRHDP